VGEKEKGDAQVKGGLERPAEEGGGVVTRVAEDEEEDEEAFREQLADVIERVNTRQRREQERTGVPCSFGPSFDLPFSHRGDDETD